MPNFIVGARLHDYGKGTPDELFGKVSADGFAAVQLAYKKCVPSVKSYADVTDALVAETVAAEKAHRIQVAVLLCRSLAEILPAAEALGVTVGIEPVTYHSMNSAAATRHILDTMRSPNLKVIFDMSNLVSAENVDTQDRIWYDMGALLGDQIVAVHFKGQAFAPDGSLLHTSLEESRTDYAGAFAMLRQLPQPALPVLREEAVPARAASDIAFMKGFF